MAGKISYIEDGSGNFILPVTTCDAIFMKDGGTTLENQLLKLDNKSIFVKDIEISSNDWVDDIESSGFWIYDIANSNIKSTDIVDVIIHLNYLKLATSVEPVSESFDGYVRIFSEVKLLKDIVVSLKIQSGKSIL